jgi:hypothetical protein
MCERVSECVCERETVCVRASEWESENEYRAMELRAGLCVCV